MLLKLILYIIAIALIIVPILLWQFKFSNKYLNAMRDSKSVDAIVTAHVLAQRVLDRCFYVSCSGLALLWGCAFFYGIGWLMK